MWSYSHSHTLIFWKSNQNRAALSFASLWQDGMPVMTGDERHVMTRKWQQTEGSISWWHQAPRGQPFQRRDVIWQHQLKAILRGRHAVHMHRHTIPKYIGAPLSRLWKNKSVWVHSDSKLTLWKWRTPQEVSGYPQSLSWSHLQDLNSVCIPIRKILRGA